MEIFNTTAAMLASYNDMMSSINEAAQTQSKRAYGGFVRGVKGKWWEALTHSLILLAWKELNGKRKDLEIQGRKIKIPIRQSYLSMIEQEDVKAHIENKPHFFMASVDKHVYVKGAFVMGIECKNYTENAMLKRIMLDFMMLRSQYPNLKCALFQLESQLGGDHSELNEITLGSKSSHTIMSLFDFPLQIVTFLKGERKVDQPIHKPGFYKQLDESQLLIAKELLKKELIEFI